MSFVQLAQVEAVAAGAGGVGEQGDELRFADLVGQRLAGVSAKNAASSAAVAVSIGTRSASSARRIRW